LVDASLIPTFRADELFTVASYKVEASDTPDGGNVQVCNHHAGGKFDLVFSAPVRVSVAFPARRGRSVEEFENPSLTRDLIYPMTPRVYTDVKLSLALLHFPQNLTSHNDF
jgi:hypothetical protein